MKLLFAHDHFFKKSSDGIVYSSAAYPSNSWERYLRHFDELTVVGRCSDMLVGEENFLVKSTHHQVKFFFVGKVSNPVNFINSSLKVEKAIKEEVKKVDAVVARLPSENGLIAIRCARKVGKPYSVEVVGCVWDALWNHGSLLAKIYAPLAYFRMKRAVASSKRTLYVTSDFLQGRYPASQGSMTVSASNVEVNALEYTGQAKNRGKEGKVTFGLIGNYKTKYKGIHLAIEALSLLDDELVDFEFRVLGNGDPSYYYELSSRLGIAEKVVFSGGLPNGDPVMRWLDQVDIYLQPSLQEGLPRALIEAMSRGCVCIGSDAGGIPELLDPPLIHKAGDSKSLADKIKYVANASDLWADMSARNVKKSQGYDKSILRDVRLRFYGELAKECRHNA